MALPFDVAEQKFRRIPSIITIGIEQPVLEPIGEIVFHGLTPKCGCIPLPLVRVVAKIGNQMRIVR